MGIDERVSRHYESHDEAARLRAPGLGDLVRLRTWDIFERHLPAPGALVDVGGGPGTHSAHLVGRGWDVHLVDPMPHHVEIARGAVPAGPGRFRASVGDGQALPVDDAAAEAVLVMGPLYHLVERADRVAALAEARRVLRPGGTVVAEVITRCAWVLDATVKDLLHEPRVWDAFAENLATGRSQPQPVAGDDDRGGFWAYFHRPEELAAELAEAGFADVELLAVEGFAWLLGDLERRMADPDGLLRAVRLTESEPSLLGCSAHVIGVARRPG